MLSSFFIIQKWNQNVSSAELFFFYFFCESTQPAVHDFVGRSGGCGAGGAVSKVGFGL